MAKKWSTYQLQFLKANYNKLGNKEIGDIIGRSEPAVKKQLMQLGYKRNAKALRVIRSRMAKRPNAGQYTAGHKPHNTKYNGHERITKDGYVEIRMSKGDYQLKHRVAWEKKHGKINEGWCLKCLSEDKTNTDPSNWKLITRIENILRNSRYDIPKEVIPSLVLVNRVQQKLNTINYGKE